ncbi:MAG: extracellular solute-binding protein [Clostridium sp.]|nr:extracellular solute-binding protein [Clostridium sp.]MCM1398414.1 extracellular solute-binding protein [Clostridium sp.]MCM1458921.1 extracellular solute-binding protein [Bacteroides sp.]
MKKISVTVILMVLFSVIMAGCGNKKETVTINIKVPTLTMSTPADSDVTSALIFLEKVKEDFVEQYEDADVIINLTEFDLVKEDEAIKGCFDTDDAVDVLYEGYFNMATYIHTGRVVPLDDIISSDLRADINQSYWDMSSINGKTYMMPFLSLQNIMVYNKELMRNAGLDQYIGDDEEIQNWSLEEWEEILSTLKKNNPEGVYCMPMYAGNNQGDTHVMSLIRSQGSDFFDENGRFYINTPEGIAGLQWIKDNYDKGYFPPHCADMEINDMGELFYNGQMVLYIGNNAMNDDVTDIDYGMVNFPCASGNGIATSFVTGFEVFDNGDEAKLKVAKDFVKYVYENEKWMDYSAGGIPASNTIAQKYKSDIKRLHAYIENADNVVDFTNNNPNWRGVRDVFYPIINDLLSGEITAAEAAEALDRDCNNAIEEGYESSTLHD